MSLPTRIIKRNGLPVDYDLDRIATAIFKAAKNTFLSSLHLGVFVE